MSHLSFSPACSLSPSLGFLSSSMHVLSGPILGCWIGGARSWGEIGLVVRVPVYKAGTEVLASWLALELAQHLSLRTATLASHLPSPQ